MPSTFAYRQDIDGLRAVAVLAVVLFHLFGTRLVPQGFLGVDIFFVISGFLITSIIYREMNEGRFRFATFYVRRIKRILPLFFTILLLGLGATYWLYMPADWDNVWTSSVAASVFMANLFFMRGYSYFDIAFEEKPFLHLWSLSVEEQFYFLFPLLLFLVLRTRALRTHRYTLFYALIVLGVVAAFFDPKSVGLNWDSYYFPHLRFPEMLVGSILAMKRTDGAWSGTKYARVGVCLGVAIVGVMLFFPLTLRAPLFPGLWTVVLSVGVALIIWRGSLPTKGNGWLCGTPLVWLGKVSYSLYLWHWLLLSMYRYFCGNSPLSWREGGAFLLLSIALSALTYYAIEQPLRRRTYRFRTAFVALYLLPLGVVFGCHFLPEKQPLKDPDMRFDVGENFSFNTVDRHLLLGDTTATPSVLVLGDSHAGHLGIFFDLMGKAEGWSGRGYGINSMPFFFDEILETEHMDAPMARKRYEAVMKDYATAKRIVLSAYWGVSEYNDMPEFLPMLDRTLARLVKDGKAVYVVASMYHVVTPRIHNYYVEERGIPFPRFERTTYKDAEFYAERQRANRLRAHIAKHFPTVHWVDLTPYLPANLLYKGKPVLEDVAHWNAWGARYLATQVQRHGGLFKESYGHTSSKKSAHF